MNICRSIAAASLLLLSPASAQVVGKALERPDPASLTVPDVTFTPTKSDLRRFDEYYYFNKPGIDYARAFADLDQCRGYAQAAKFVSFTPMMVPLGADAIRTPEFKPGMQPGLLVAFLIADAESDYGRVMARRCMHFKGYARYGLTRALSKQMDQGSDAEKLGRQALLASGPQPQAGAVEP